jgi:hypothetical protein
MHVDLTQIEAGVGLVLFALHLLSKYKIVKSQLIDDLYQEAVRFGEQWKKATGQETGIVPSNETVRKQAESFLINRLPKGVTVDQAKLEAAVALFNTLRK